MAETPMEFYFVPDPDNPSSMKIPTNDELQK
jgi:hypothetical protein